MAPSKTALARTPGVSRQSLYYKPVRPQKDAQLKEDILSVLAQHPAYGYRRICIALAINNKRVRRGMHTYNIRPTIMRGRKKWVKNTTEIVMETIPNRIKDICPIQPDVVWVGDFTHLTFHAREIYLATVMDAYTREIIGWQIGLHHTTRLTLDVLEEAKRKRKNTPAFFHSDQGSEYTASESIRWLIKNEIAPSMSPKGKPWNNGKQESFYLTFKIECGVPQKLPTIEALIEVIGKFINYYNTRRIHSKLKMPPKIFCEKMRRK